MKSSLLYSKRTIIEIAFEQIPFKIPPLILIRKTEITDMCATKLTAKIANKAPR